MGNPGYAGHTQPDYPPPDQAGQPGSILGLIGPGWGLTVRSISSVRAAEKRKIKKITKGCKTVGPLGLWRLCSHRSRLTSARLALESGPTRQVDPSLSAPESHLAKGLSYKMAHGPPPERFGHGHLESKHVRGTTRTRRSRPNRPNRSNSGTQPRGARTVVVLLCTRDKKTTLLCGTRTSNMLRQSRIQKLPMSWGKCS